MASPSSPSKFGDGGIHFSCSEKFQVQNKIGLIHSLGGGVHEGYGVWSIYGKTRFGRSMQISRLNL